MKPCPSPLSALSLFTILLVIMALTIACGASTRLVTINLHESELNEIIQDSANITSMDGWSFVIQNIEIKDGFLRIHGDYTPLGSNMVSGSLDIALKAEDGSLKGEIEQIDIQGFVAPDQALTIVNNLVVQVIGKSVSEGKNQVEFESVDIQEGIVKIVFRFLP